MALTMEDLIIAARTVWGEARGESFEGKKAVVHVLCNRVKLAGVTFAQVCLRPKQFSCWNPDDPNFQLLQRASCDNPDFRECVRAVLEALAEAEDPTCGSTHYLTREAFVRMQEAAARDATNWAKDLNFSAEIGSHLFFNNVT